MGEGGVPKHRATGVAFYLILSIERLRQLDAVPASTRVVCPSQVYRHPSLVQLATAMTSYYGDRPRDVPSWDSLDGGDDDDLIRSEVRNSAPWYLKSAK
jgi:hypothetical protein